jgi:hypothetical protein
VLNAQIHPTVRFFMGLSKERVLQRYCHLNPNVDKQALDEVLQYKPTYLRYFFKRKGKYESGAERVLLALPLLKVKPAAFNFLPRCQQVT